MGRQSWYYVGRSGERRGPVAADDLVAAWSAGLLRGDGLVWREGMAEWLPFDRVRGELGVEPAQSRPPPPVQPYAPPRSSILGEAGNIDRIDVVPAGFLRRWAALMLDSLILGVVLFVLAFVLTLATGAWHQQAGQPPSPLMLLLYPVYYLIAMLYYALQESSAQQATLGKRALGIKVTDEDGRPIGFGRACARWFASALSYLILYIGFFMAAFTDRKRALHDMIAGTLVVDRWAYTRHPERQQRGLSGGVIVFVVLAVCFVPFVAILAAIAIPAYQDYTIRSQVAEAGTLGDGPKTAVANFHAEHQGWPANNTAAGLPDPAWIQGPYISGVAVENGVVKVTFGNKANQMIAGRVLAFAPHGQADGVAWTCDSAAGTTIDVKFRPISCRP